MLELQSVSHTYPNGKIALQGVSLCVRPGRIFGLIGPNGAGKSTLLKLASGILEPESGRIFCAGNEVTGSSETAASFVSLMPDPLGVYTDITSEEYLEFYSRLYGISAPERRRRIDQVVDMLELSPWLSHDVEVLSAGWQRRLALGRILLSRASIFLLDEPAAGLDVLARTELLRIVRKLSIEQKTVVISSHILSELEDLADEFGVLANGKWVEVTEGNPFFTSEELAGGIWGAKWKLRCTSIENAQSIVDQSGCSIIEVSEGELSFTAETEEIAADLLRAVIESGSQVFEFSKIQRDLDSLVKNLLSKGK